MKGLRGYGRGPGGESPGRRSKYTGARCLPVFALLLSLIMFGVCVGACGPPDAGSSDSDSGLSVVTDVSFLADIAQNVAGDRLQVTALVPLGADPHSFQATPSDAERLAAADLVIINCEGLSPSLDQLIRGTVGPGVQVVEAAAGITEAREDPHVWLDPINVQSYVEHILSAFESLDPAGVETFGANAKRYNQRLQELHEWIKSEVAKVPVERRLLVTEHESLNYFAERYGFQVVGTIFPSVSGESSPSARHLSQLVEAIRQSGAPAVFVEVGSNEELAGRVAREAGAKLVSGLRIHFLDDEVRSYLDMMRVNVETIVNALQ